MEMEHAFGRPFSGLDVVTGADDLVRSVGAEALTTGNTVIFGDQNPGRAEVAHELAHVAQQQVGGGGSTTNGRATHRSDSVEKEAEAAEHAVTAGEPVGRLSPSNATVHGIWEGDSGTCNDDGSYSTNKNGESEETKYPYDPTYSPSEENCSYYDDNANAQNFMSSTYSLNASSACEETPDDANNNCVRACLQNKFELFADEADQGGLAIPALTITDPLCPDLYEMHDQCYLECLCDNGFIDYSMFKTMCMIPFPSSFVGWSINTFNACNNKVSGDVGEGIDGGTVSGDSQNSGSSEDGGSGTGEGGGESEGGI